MSLRTKCPHCERETVLAAEVLGKSVRCKGCSKTFAVRPVGPAGKPAADVERRVAVRAGQPTPAHARSRPADHCDDDEDDPPLCREQPAESQTTLRIGLGAIGLVTVVASAVTFALIVNRHPQVIAQGPPPQVKLQPAFNPQVAKQPKAHQTKPEQPKVDAAKVDLVNVERPKPDSKVEPRIGPRNDPKTPPEFKAVEAPVAPLLKTAGVEITEIEAIRDVFLMQGATPRVGVRVKDKNKAYFETYDLDKGLRIGRFEIPKDTLYLDVDPEGATLALCDNNKFLTVYELPSGAHLQEDWRPYHDNRQDSRMIGDSGDYVQFSMLSKDNFLVLTTRNAGDVWDVRTKTLKSVIVGFSHEEFKNSHVARGHDCGLSADRTMFAYATDEGIAFFDTTKGEKVGQTAKLSSFGPKGQVDVLGIGFDPQKKSIAAYIAAGKDVVLARFQVPGGEPIGTPESVDDPGDFANIAFVSDNVFMACERPSGKKNNRDANRVGNLVDLSGQRLVECVFSPRRNGMFSASVAKKQVAFAYLNNNKPALGLVEIPTPGLASAAPAPPEMPTTSGDKEKTAEPAPAPPSKGFDLLDVINKNPTPQPPGKTANPKEKTPSAAPPSTPSVRQERWEFGAQGIAKKGETR